MVGNLTQIKIKIKICVQVNIKIQQIIVCTKKIMFRIQAHDLVQLIDIW